MSGFRPGETIGVWGAGPVGLMAAYSATLRGASRVFVVDRVPERLAAAEKIGCIPIDFSKGDAVNQILERNDHKMLDRSVDAVGYQAVDTGGKTEQPNIVLENMIMATRPCGGLGIPGLSLNRYMGIRHDFNSWQVFMFPPIQARRMKTVRMVASLCPLGSFLRR